MTHRRQTIAHLLAGVLFNLFSLAQAAKAPVITVSQRGLKFKVFYSDDGRTKPLKMTLKADDENSVYMFDTDGNVTDIAVGDLRYQVGPTSVTDVSLADDNQPPGPTRRVLAEDNRETQNHLLERSSVERRRLFPCGDCEDAWSLMCGRGLQSVCNLVDYGPPFGDSAEVSVSTVCNGFGVACSGLTVHQACENQCEDEYGTGQ